jgi:hypothetical protein
MSLLDFAFLKLFHFVFYLKRENDSAKWGAFLYMSSYIAICIVSFVCFIGLLYDNQLCQYIKNNSLFFWMAAFILSPILLSFRYYRYTSVAAIEKSYNTMEKSKRKLIDMLIYVSMITIPVLTFILFRLYVIGHLKWW